MQLNNNNHFDFVYYGHHSNPHINKIKLIFEELKSLGVTWDFREINTVKQENYSDEFIEQNPNKKIPALVDNTFEEPFFIFESGSVLIYLSQKYSKFLPDFRINSGVNTWTVYQVANLGSSLSRYTPSSNEFSQKQPQQLDSEVERVLKLLDERLAVNQYIGGKDYSIADIATAGWLLYLNHMPLFNCTRDSHKNIFKWLELINQRESVQKVSSQIKDSLISFNLIPTIRSL
ncbi:hypothetical protein DICPUDRAFT_96918 [Dictyostelium purpureum]|uniref:Glutathione S-transferase n=1 Tax=Dictyostelium purpureum TaxID=5786 RepID=F0ZC95_DICPU|nr:uncharacterized protein DICPUDRAFT_96918 [Dictyostelium purpureum]EGC38459.1 hypothetical protein DICPUDRAFT_96918 [Dictyostelium purpureum]|eukprot:XP_003285017.1 hypothetical protein DICPUDRAFT_96918 [Dictyostelium purpureum]